MVLLFGPVLVWYRRFFSFLMTTYDTLASNFILRLDLCSDCILNNYIK